MWSRSAASVILAPLRTEIDTTFAGPVAPSCLGLLVSFAMSVGCGADGASTASTDATQSSLETSSSADGSTADTAAASTGAPTTGTPSDDTSTTSGATGSDSGEPTGGDPATTGESPLCDAPQGPNGLHWPPNTPPYITPATTKIDSLSGLNAALAAAAAGDVIEVAPHVFTDSLEITAGNPEWAQNVLVRPPLGQRQSVVIQGALDLVSPNVTIAGLQIDSVVSMRDGGDHCFLARSVLGPDGLLLANNTFDSGWYELVATEPKSGGDRSQIKAGKDKQSAGFRVEGVWLKGAYRIIDSADHSDTLQITGVTGGVVHDVTLADSVLWPSANAALLIGAADGTVVRNTWLAACGVEYVTDVLPGHECGGHHAMQGGIANEVYAAIVLGTLNGSQPYAVVHDTQCQKIAEPPLDAKNNTVDPNLNVPPPPLCDLDMIWD